MIKTAQRFVFFLLFAFCFLLFASVPSFAQTQTSNFTTPNTNPDVPQNLHTLTQSVTIEVMSAIICQIVGVDVVNQNQKCLGVDPQSGKIGFVEGGGGLIGLTTNVIASLYNPPLHTGDYLNYLTSNFGLAKPAYAQGVGLGGLNPLIPLWTSFRNIVYLLFVVVFVLIGLAIMLRVKIDPRTVMGIQNQIPKIIIGIVLVTFSLGIAGFLIDMMWVSTYLVTNIIAGADKTLKVQDVNSQIYAPPIGFLNHVYSEPLIANWGPSLGGVLGLAGQAGRSVQVVLDKSFHPDTWEDIFNPLGGGVHSTLTGGKGNDIPLLGGIANILGGFANSIVKGVLNALGLIASWLIGIVFIVIFMIALLWALLRLGFELIKAYVMILIDIVIAPFIIVAGLVPGSPAGFGMWLRDILANLSAFPTTIAMFLLGRTFIQVVGKTHGEFFTPPLIGNPGSAATGANEIASFIGLGIVLLTPQVVAMVKEVFKAPQFKFGTAIGQAVGVGGGAINLPGHAQKIGMFAYGMEHIPGIRRVPILGNFLGGRQQQNP